MLHRDYDTVQGITDQLQSLEGLHAWIAERHEAYYVRKESLHSFVVLNRWVADRCGNVSRILELEPKVRLAPVVDLDELHKTVKLRLSYGDGGGPLLPRADARCDVCGVGWTLDDVHEHVSRRGAEDANGKNTYTFYHTKCWRLWQLKTEHEHFAGIFRDACYDIAVLTQTPNQYWPGAADRYHAAPWFHVETKVGRFLIGWRKRVIHIEWSEIDRDLSCLFEDVTHTKDPHYIHAYSAEKASEYLRRIREALDPLTSKEFEIWSQFQTKDEEWNKPGWGLMHGRAKGADFLDACRQFFKPKPGEEPDLDYQSYDNLFNGARLYPTQHEAQGVRPPVKTGFENDKAQIIGPKTVLGS